MLEVFLLKLTSILKNIKYSLRKLKSCFMFKESSLKKIKNLKDLHLMKNEEVGVSPWVRVSQAQVDMFAGATLDLDWMHIDIERAKMGPVGETIGQGFLTLALLTHFSHELNFFPEDIVYAYNYGLDHVRWMEPVRVGSRIRNRMTLLEVKERENHQFLIKSKNVIEIENSPKPAMIAEWLGLLQGSEQGEEYRSWCNTD